MADRFAGLVAVPTLMLVLAVVTVALRCWVKKVLLRTFAWDDWFMLVALAVFTALVIISYVGITYGTGYKHMVDLPPSSISLSLHLWTTGSIVYLVDAILIKTSISIFLLRLAMEKWQRYLIYATLFVYTVTSIGFIFNTLLQCSPIAFAWDKSIPNGTCRSMVQFSYATNANAALTTGTDLVYALLPIWMVHKIQMNIHVKISVIVVLGMGLLSTAATCFRFLYVNNIGVTDGFNDFLYDVYYIEIWSTVEPGLGITAASAATLRPLLRIFTRNARSWAGATTPANSNPAAPSPTGGRARDMLASDAKEEGASKGYLRRSGSPDTQLLEEMAPVGRLGTGEEKNEAVQFEVKDLEGSLRSSV